LSLCSYIKLDGIKFNVASSAYGIQIASVNYYKKITDCELYGNQHTMITLGCLRPSDHNWIHGNIITARAGSGCSEGRGGTRVGLACDNYCSLSNTIENNTFYNVGHANIYLYSHRYTVIRKNIAHNEPWWRGTSNL
jgi:parallel beta-helix repeat protein